MRYLDKAVIRRKRQDQIRIAWNARIVKKIVNAMTESPQFVADGIRDFISLLPADEGNIKRLHGL